MPSIKRSALVSLAISIVLLLASVASVVANDIQTPFP